jgi:hypothetical protein
MKTWNAFVRGAAAAALPLLAAVPLRADEVPRWNRVATDAAARARTDPFTESRAFAILHLAAGGRRCAVRRQASSPTT